jgi:hypothetical protein
MQLDCIMASFLSLFSGKSWNAYFIKQRKEFSMKKTIIFILLVITNGVIHAQNEFNLDMTLKESAKYLTDMDYGFQSSNRSNSGSGISNISFGGGLLLGGEFLNQTLKLTNGVWANHTAEDTFHVNTFNAGLFGFFDVTYAEANVSLYYGSRKYENDLAGSTRTGSKINLNIGILGKYPLNTNPIRLFPLLGIQYSMLLSSEWEGTKATGDLSKSNALWINVGGGFDHLISRKVFVRGEALWGFKLNTENEKNGKITNTSTGEQTGTISYFTHGPTIKVGLGYIF